MSSSGSDESNGQKIVVTVRPGREYLPPKPVGGSDRTIADFHATRESGSGCPETDGGAHYFIFADPQLDGRSCMDCGEPEQPRKEQKK